MMVTRRSFVGGASALGVSAAAGLPGQIRRAIAAPAAPSVMTLREAGRRSGVLVGTAVAVPALRQSPDYAELVRSQSSIVVGENAMKFGPLRPGPHEFFFDDADYLVEFAQKNGIKVRGHNFVWHRQLPKWFDGYVTQANAEQVLVDHIERVGGRYAGRMHSWDVCNEVIHLQDGLGGGLRNSPWYKLLGPGYIDLAYRTARRVDPHALLCYNDYDIESDSDDQAAKRAAVLELVRGMKARGVPLDGLGIQSHISAGSRHRYGAGLTAFMAEAQSAGLKLLVTEMDVNDRDLPAADAERDAAVGDVYGSYLRTALSNSAMIAVITWGITDKYTWLNGEGSRPDHLPERCLPFDAALQPVPAFAAEVEALRTAPPRGNATKKG